MVFMGEEFSNKKEIFEKTTFRIISNQISDNYLGNDTFFKSGIAHFLP